MERGDDWMILVVRTDGTKLAKDLFTSSSKYLPQIQSASGLIFISYSLCEEDNNATKCWAQMKELRVLRGWTRVVGKGHRRKTD
jgi:hypothetical protein